MAEFCRECVRKVMGLDPDSKLGKAWLAPYGHPCEGCVDEYLKRDKARCTNETKYLLFSREDFQTPNRKTEKWSVYSRLHNTLLGKISWWGSWRCYALFPEPETLFNKTCLDDISSFLESLMTKRKRGL